MYFKWPWTSHAMHVRHYAIWLGNTSPQASVCVHIYIICKAYLTTAGLQQELSHRELPHNRQKVLTEKKQRTYLLLSMAENEEREVQDVLNELDEL